MAKKSFKGFPVLSPLPCVMVSCGSMEKPNIITIAWTGIVNSDPPMTYISVRKSRFSHHLIKESGEFVINLPSKYLVFETDKCGVISGAEHDKFKEMGLTPVLSEKLGCPLIEECPVNIECRIVNTLELPSHDMFIAEIVSVHVDEKYVDEKGSINIEKAGLLSYVHAKYVSASSKVIGSYGYSVMKPKTKKKLSAEGKLKAKVGEGRGSHKKARSKKE